RAGSRGRSTWTTGRSLRRGPSTTGHTQTTCSSTSAARANRPTTPRSSPLTPACGVSAYRNTTFRLSPRPKALGRDPFTLSRRTGGLEDELGLPLFERRHGGVLLKSGGKAVLGHGRRALAEIHLIKRP